MRRSLEFGALNLSARSRIRNPTTKAVMERSLEGKVAIVTGAASGIGKAVAQQLAHHGATVAIIDKDERMAREVVAVLDGSQRHIVQPLDLTDHGAIAGIVEAIRSEAGRIDILVNSAGIVDSGQTMLNIDEDLWDRIYAVNIKAPMLLMKAVAAVMVREGIAGRIVNITSSSAFRAVMSFPAYGSSKAALTQLSRTAAADLGAHNINVNCVAPGITRTPLLAKIDVDSRIKDLVESGPLANLLRRVSEPEDVAEAVLFLCSAGGRQITGQTIHVSAGAIV